MLILVPVKKLSAQMTWWPWPTRRSQRWLPRNPAPPVTRTVLLPLYLRMLVVPSRDEFCRSTLWVASGFFIRKPKRFVGRQNSSLRRKKCSRCMQEQRAPHAYNPRMRSRPATSFLSVRGHVEEHHVQKPRRHGIGGQLHSLSHPCTAARAV